MTVGLPSINTNPLYQHRADQHYPHYNRRNRDWHSNRFTCRSNCSLGSNTITISGTPTASGTFNYSIPLAGGCGTVNATGTITVTQTILYRAFFHTNTLYQHPLTNITHTTTGATGIGTPTGLPAGVTAAWAANTITISGTPTVSGTFNYSIPLLAVAVLSMQRER